MPGVVDTPKLLGAVLPKTLTIANGDVIQLQVHDADEQVEDVAFPVLRFGQLTFALDHVQSHGGWQDANETVSAEAHTYLPGTTVYQVDQRDIVPGTTSVSATVGGSTATLAESTDYVLAKTGTYTTYDAIEFTTLPDDNTGFTITYDQHKVSSLASIRYRPVYRLMLHVSALQPGERGATVYHAKSRLGQQLYEALVGQLTLLAGRNLAGAGELVVSGVQSIGRINVSEGQSLASYAVDLKLKRHHQAVGVPVELVGDVQATTTETIARFQVV